MSNEYQLRKDIDELYHRLFDIESGELLVASKEDLDNIIDRLDKNSFEELETNLSSFEEDLDDFQTSITSFREDLGDYGDALSDFKIAMDGDPDNPDDKGFMDLLDQLEVWTYGKGQTYEDPETGEIKEYTPDFPAPLSLKGSLKTLRSELDLIISGDQALAINLDDLKGYLVGFEGTLQDFKDALEEAGLDVTTINDGLLQLIYKLSVTVPMVEEHKEKLDDFNDLIGDPTDSASEQEEEGESVTIFGIINDTSDTADDLTDKYDEVDVILNGDGEDVGLIEKTDDMIATVGDENTGLIAQTNDIIDTIGEPAVGQQSATGLHLLIDNAQETADAVGGVATLIKEKIGYNQIGNTNLQSQITAHDGDISDIQGDIGTVPTGKTLQGQITAHDGEIGTVQDQIGDVDTDWQGDLQSQINDVIYAVLDMLPVIHIVETLSDVSTMEMGRRGYIAPYGFPYNYIYVKDTGKYYELITQDGE